MAAIVRAAQAIQLSMEYDPEPPFYASSTAKAHGHIREPVEAVAAQRTRSGGPATSPARTR